MDIILGALKHIEVKIGLLFIVIAIVVGVFKQSWLIAGVNTMSKKEKEKMDLDYLAKQFGICFGIFGMFMVLIPFLYNLLNLNHGHRAIIMMIAIFSFCGFLIVWLNVVKKDRIYNKKTTEQSQDIPTKKWRKVIPIAIVVPVGLFIYLGYKEPKVLFDTNSFKLKGVYGVNLPFAEIAEADTIVWSKMPAISIRTNGISLNKVNRGKFKTVSGEKIHLNIHRGVSPVIRIVEKDGSVYYINRKNATETRQIFKKLNINNDE
jgi:hypothetical protein